MDIAASFRDPFAREGKTSKPEVMSTKSLGKGAGLSDALEFLLSFIEKIPVFPDIPDDPLTQDTRCSQKDEIVLAPSDDYTSFFGIVMEAATPTTSTSLERKRFHGRGASPGSANRGGQRMFGRLERRVDPPTHLSSLSMTKMVRKSASLPILCSDRTVRIENSSIGKRNEVSGDNNAPRSDSPHETTRRKYSMRAIRNKSASLPIMIIDESSFQFNKKKSNATNIFEPNATLKTKQAQTLAKKSAKGKHKKKPRPKSPKPRPRSISPFKRLLASRNDESTTRPKSRSKRISLTKVDKPTSHSISPFKRNKAWRTDEPKRRPERPRPISPVKWNKAQKESESDLSARTRSRAISPLKGNQKSPTESKSKTRREKPKVGSKSPPKKSTHHLSTKTFLTASAKGNLLVEI